MSRCWAYSPDGTNRCELEAGHDEDHTTFRVWKDEQCWQPTPTGSGHNPAAKSAPIVVPPPPPADPADIKCVACSHRHRAGECKCGCKEFIG